MKKVSVLFFMAILVHGFANAQPLEKYERSSFIADGDTLPYRILFPENFDPSKKYPLVFFLHGRGESGKDNLAQLTHGAKLFLLESNRKNFPAIVVFPQCPKDSYWSNVNIEKDSSGKRMFEFRKGGKPTKAMKLALGLLERLKDKPYVDEDRIYAGGLSMGAMGTFELLRREPKTFAAAFAICGGDNVKNVRKYKHVPLWIFHGAKDDVVPPEKSQVVVDELRRLDANVKFTLYPNANHNSWDAAFGERELLRWLFSYKK